MRMLILCVHTHRASTEERRKKWSCSRGRQLNIILYWYHPQTPGSDKMFNKYNKHLISIALYIATLPSECTGIYQLLHTRFLFLLSLKPCYQCLQQITLSLPAVLLLSEINPDSKCVPSREERRAERGACTYQA